MFKKKIFKMKENIYMSELRISWDPENKVTVEEQKPHIIET